MLLQFAATHFNDFGMGTPADGTLAASYSRTSARPPAADQTLAAARNFCQRLESMTLERSINNHGSFADALAEMITSSAQDG
jgi:hypothetical protein